MRNPKVVVTGLIVLSLLAVLAFAAPAFASRITSFSSQGPAVTNDQDNWDPMHEACLSGDYDAMLEAMKALGTENYEGMLDHMSQMHGTDFADMSQHMRDVHGDSFDSGSHCGGSAEGAQDTGSTWQGMGGMMGGMMKGMMGFN